MCSSKVPSMASLLISNQQAICREEFKIKSLCEHVAEMCRLAVRNQQVVGSNPTGGSRKSDNHKASRVYLGQPCDRSLANAGNCPSLSRSTIISVRSQ